MMRRTAPRIDAISRLLSADAGSTALEFAFILPVLLLIIFGVFEFGRMFWTQNTLQYAVEQTARQLITAPVTTNPVLTDCSTSTDNTTAVTNNLVSLDPSLVTVSFSSETNTGSGLATQPKACTIQATYSFSFFAYLGLPTITIEGQSTIPCGSLTCS